MSGNVQLKASKWDKSLGDSKDAMSAFHRRSELFLQYLGAQSKGLQSLRD